MSVYLSLPCHVAGLVACYEDVRHGEEDQTVRVSVGRVAQGVQGGGGEVAPG